MSAIVCPRNLTITPSANSKLGAQVGWSATLPERRICGRPQRNRRVVRCPSEASLQRFGDYTLMWIPESADRRGNYDRLVEPAFLGQYPADICKSTRRENCCDF